MRRSATEEGVAGGFVGFGVDVGGIADGGEVMHR